MRSRLYPVSFLWAFAAMSFAAPGDLDPGFGSGGKMLTPVGSTDAYAYAMAMQPDGKLVVVGSCSNGSNKDFAVVRYNTDGSLDNGFGTNGAATTDFGNTNDDAFGVALQDDGKIVVVGGAAVGSSSVFALARYDANGSLDSSFGTSGKVKTTLLPANSAYQLRAVKVLDNGQILAAGTSYNGSNTDFALLRYNGDGTLDLGFGTGGLVTTDIASSSADVGQALALQPDLNNPNNPPKILVAGFAKSSAVFAVTRYTTSGVLDTTFATSGKFTSTQVANCYGLALQSDGKIVLAGSINSTADFCLMRLTEAGALDTTFGSSGVVTTTVGTAADVACGVTVQPDGKLVAAGYSFDANVGYNDFALVRYNSSGSLDGTFQSTGKVTTALNGDAYGRGVVMDGKGRVVVAGYAKDGTYNKITLARYSVTGFIEAPAYGARTSNNQPTISGTAEVGATLSLSLDGVTLGTATVDDTGAWSFALSGVLVEGLHTVIATTGAISDTVKFTVDTTAPVAPAITNPVGGTLVTSSWPVIGGTAEAGSTVTIYLDEVAAATAQPNGAGGWSFTPTTALASGSHTVRATATDLAGNTGTSSVTVSYSTTAPLFTGPGDLDPSFGTSGKVMTAIGSSGDANAYAMAMQSDGEVVLAGSCASGSYKDFAVVRYNNDGSLDTSFNGTGVVTTDFGTNTTDEAFGVAVQADGKIVVVGRSLTGSTSVFALVRYYPDGSLDTSFGPAGTGKIRTTLGATYSGTQATGVKLQADGKICVSGVASVSAAGSNQSPSGLDYVVLRYNSNGTLDIGFGAGGMASSDRGYDDTGRALGLRNDGKIVVCGNCTGYMAALVGMACFNSDGTPDTSFNTTGSVWIGVSDVWCSVMTQSDGRIVVAGSTGSGSTDFVLSRYSTSGTVDSSFGSAGTAKTGVGTGADVSYSLAVQSDGKLVASGYSYNANTNFNDFALVRYNANGTLDTSFRGTGKVTTGLSAGNAYGRAMAIAPDGRILVAGYASDGTRNNFALVRYFGSGCLSATSPVNGAYTRTNPPELVGRADPYLTVHVFLNGNEVGSSVAQASGEWRFTPASALPDGSYSLTIRESDEYGSTSAFSNAVAFTIDTVTPSPPVITSHESGAQVTTNWPVITGTAEAGETVTIYFDDAAVGTALTNGSRNWGFTTPIALAAGPHTLSARVTDPAGNTGGFSSTVTFSISAALLGGPGNLDSSFGIGGKVMTAIGSGDAAAYAMAMQSDGEVVLAGSCASGSYKDFAVVRYKIDGSLDTSFNGTGVVTTDFGTNTTDEAFGVAVQADGKIVVVGRSLTGSTSAFALARYHPDGSLDTSFGSARTGKIKTTVGATYSGTQATAVKLQADGKICVSGVASLGVAGSNASPSGLDYVVLRYESNGYLDREFGAGGMASWDRGYDDTGRGLALRSDGKIVVCGNCTGYMAALVGMACFKPDGTPDTSFNTTGSVWIGVSDIWYSVMTQSDGKIVVVGATGGSSTNFELSRYSTTGTVDSSFGTAGTVKTGVGTGSDVSYSLAVQNDGKLVAAGSSFDANTNFYDFALARYNSNGTLDPTFLATGKVTTAFNGSAYGRAIVIGSDGRIWVAGYASDGTKNHFALVRYFGTNQAPVVTTGDATGIVRTGAVLNGVVNPNSMATTAHFEYGLTTSYGHATGDVAMGAGYAAVAASSTISGLTDNTVYHFRLVATNAVGTTYGADATFTTAPNPPLAFTGDAMNVSASGATLVGVVVPNTRVTSAWFEFGLSTAYGETTAAQMIPADAQLQNVFAPLSGLMAGATYHFRLVAINDGSPIPIDGEDKSFLAQAPPPVVTLGAAIPLTSTSVQLSGLVQANNAATQVYFDYGTDGVSFPFSVAATPAAVTGNADTAVAGTLTNLAQGMIYSYRLRAVNAGGTTQSDAASFTLDVLSGLFRTFPTALPSAEGFLIVNLTPSSILSGWRFVGEQQWRVSGAAVAGLTTGDRDIEFRPVPGYIHPPTESVAVISGEAATVLTRDYYQTTATGTGGLNVTLKPESITTGPDSAQWRLLGEDDTEWRESGDTIPDLIAGSYLIECKQVAGRTTPRNTDVVVKEGQTSTATITYYLPDSLTGTPPTVLAFESITNDTTKPYAYVGQIRSAGGSSTGFVVKQRVVATAAHVVWDDGTLTTAQGLEWLFQRHRGLYEPKSIAPRGYYLFTSYDDELGHHVGYPEQREIDNSPGDSSPQSQHLDVAAMYFNEDAGRGGYGGFLASDLNQNEFLLSNANKMLIGYPVDGIAPASQGRMHASTPANILFAAAYGRTFTTTQIRSSGGNSGGPLCVQYEDGNYYPAAVYLGGNAQTVVRAIDGPVIDLFNRADVSANGGGNNTGGGITHTSIAASGNSSSPGALIVLIEPEAAANAGGWRLAPETSYRPSGWQKSGLREGSYVLEMTPVSGFDTPAVQNLTVTSGQLTTVTYTYTLPPTPQELWRMANFGSMANDGISADNSDPDGDGFSNAAEYIAGTNPTSRGDFFKAENPERNGTVFSVITPGKAGRTYILERSATLASDSWSTVATQGPLGYDVAVTLYDAASPSGRAFYRIRVTGVSQ